MPQRSYRECYYTGCHILTRSTYCPEHEQIREQERYARDKIKDQQRGSPSVRGYNRRWKKARETFLSRGPICIDCKRRGIVTPATEVDHIIPHRGDSTLFWDKTNWQPLCKSCHSRKTGRGQ